MPVSNPQVGQGMMLLVSASGIRTGCVDCVNASSAVELSENETDEVAD